MNSPNQIKSLVGEVWQEVTTKHPFRHYSYHFSNFGRIMSLNPDTGDQNLLKGSLGKKGFVKLNLKLKGGNREGFYLHRLVANQFVTQDEGKDFIIHNDNIKSNNHYQNLTWVSRDELNEWMKSLPSVINKKIVLGSHVKLNTSKVALLKKRIIQNKTKQRILAKQFDISYTQLKRIERGENWGHVKAAN